MGYKQEFGVDFDLGFIEYDFPFELNDRSYRNDCCPSFWFKKGGEFYILWVDFEDAEKREYESGKRYTLVCAVNEGSDDYPEVYSDAEKPVVKESEILREIIKYI